MPECDKTHLQQSRISKLSGGGPPDPLFKGRGGKREGREGGRGRIGKGGTGKDRGRKEPKGWEGRGARHGLRPLPSPLETSSGSAPVRLRTEFCIWKRIKLRNSYDQRKSSQSSIVGPVY